MLLTIPDSASNCHADTDIVTLNAPLQYAAAGVKCEAAISAITDTVNTMMRVSAAQKLDRVMKDMLPPYLKSGIGTASAKKYCGLSPQDRTMEFANTLSGIQDDFFTVAADSGIEDSPDWILFFNEGKPALCYAEPFEYGYIKKDFEEHPLQHFIACFANIIANSYGAVSVTDLFDFAVCQLEDYVDVKDEKAFVQHYQAISEDVDNWFTPESDCDEVVEKFNAKYGHIASVDEFFDSHMLDALYAKLKEPVYFHYNKLPDLEAALITTIDQWQLWSDPYAVMLLDDISLFKGFLQPHSVNMEHCDDSSLWQHIALLAIPACGITDVHFESLHRLQDDAYNCGDEMRFTFQPDTPNWIDDLSYFAEYSFMLHRYFTYQV